VTTRSSEQELTRQSGPAIQVVVVDDHMVVREGLISVLEAADQVEVVGQAADAREALATVMDLHPDVVLLDIRLPGKSGLDVCRALHQQVPESQVIMLTSFDDEDYMFRALQAGARGYLAKTASNEEIVNAITSVAQGNRLLSAPMVDKLVTRFDRVARRIEQIESGAD
jgi:two-component system response regulator NreC